MSEKGLVGENVLNKMLSPAFKAASKKNGEHVVDNDHRVRLEQLKSHPLFNDLQVTLALDCVQSKVPYSLLGDLSSTGSSPVGFDTSFSTVSDVVAKEHANMQMMLQVYFPSLLASYQQLTDQFEIQRYKALAFNCHSSDANQLINWFYNRERENLIKGMKLTLDAVTKKTKALIPDPIKMNVDIWNNLASNIGLPPPVVPPAPTVTEHGETPLDLSGSQNKQSTTSTTGQKKSRFLSKKAVSILQRWYQQHREHPYATDEEVKELAAAGGISHNQVKKWMANTRARSYNTLTYNGGKHMLNSKLAMKKRLFHKYRIEPLTSSSSAAENKPTTAESKVSSEIVESKEEVIDVETVCRQSPDLEAMSANVSSESLSEGNAKVALESDKQSLPTSKPSLEQVIARCHLKSSEMAVEPSQNKSVIESLQDVVKNVTSIDSSETESNVDNSPDQTSNSKRYLSSKAKAILSDWFRKHLYRPYPTYEEKKELAALCGISSAKVDTWFANKRNRTQNTKKLPPKYSHLLR